MFPYNNVLLKLFKNIFIDDGEKKVMFPYNNVLLKLKKCLELKLKGN